MNERMIELHKQAAEFAYKTCKEEGRTGAQTEYIRNILTTSKFAELIVRECAKVADDGFASSNFGNGIAGHQLLKHFGVEE